MKLLISKDWLQSFFDKPLPETKVLQEVFTNYLFEVEAINKVGPDDVFELSLLPNRGSDCASHYGIAKEISAILQLPLKKKYFTNSPTLPAHTSLKISIDNKGCTRFMVAGLTVKKGVTPSWMKRRLEAIGQQTIHPIVDITNYVMFELGQPSHAFNKEVFASPTHIAVRSAKEGEKIVDLTGKEAIMKKDEMLIVDKTSDTPLGIAGIKGGQNGGVNENTTEIVLEMAHFKGEVIHTTSRRLNLITDASLRFERNPQEEIIPYCMERAIELFTDILGARVVDFYDAYPRPRLITYKTGISIEYLNKISGKKMTLQNTLKLLKRLDFNPEVVNVRERVLQCAKEHIGKTYTYGASVLYDAPKKFDCSSFVNYCFSRAGVSIPRISANIYLFAQKIDKKDVKKGDLIFAVIKNEKESIKKIHNTFTPEAKIPYLEGTIPERGIDHVGIMTSKNTFIHASMHGGIREVKMSEFTPTQEVVGFGRIPYEERIVVTRPLERSDINIEADVVEDIMRLSGLASYKTTKPKKQPSKNKHSTQFINTHTLLDACIEEGFSQIETYTFTKKGPITLIKSLAEDKNALRSTLREGVEDALKKNIHNKHILGLDIIKMIEVGSIFTKKGEQVNIAIAIGGVSEKVIQKEFTQLKESLKKKGIVIEGDMTHGIWEAPLLSIDIPEKELVAVKPSHKVYIPFSHYPVVLQDISLWVPNTYTAGEVKKCIIAVAGPLLSHIRLFDTFKKDKRVSYAFHLVFQSHDATLTNEEVSLIMEKIYTTVKEKKWEVR